ncbi:MAG TPA: protein kinase, partial [Vicinamibacterales bacterium]|nr:protein kinase [Vicinamibacterales bacterium]
MLHQIGVGALGPVFRTYEPTRDRLVAVKVFRLDLTPEQSSALADELARATQVGLFHPSIVEPLAAGLEGTVAYRAEEYVAAESLDVAMRHYAPATMDKALPFITQLAAAIDFARAAGVGHGALHPRDIFVTPDEARASGFGVVDALERLGLRAPVRRPYSSPERIAGKPWTTAADVFSLGAIAFELLTGRRPSGLGEQMGVLSGASLGSHEAEIRAVLARAMAEDPEARYSSAGEFAAALAEVAALTTAAVAAGAAETREPAGATIAADAGAGQMQQAEAAEALDVAQQEDDKEPKETKHERDEKREEAADGFATLDDFAPESTAPSPGDSPREVARKAIAARKRQHKAKPPHAAPGLDLVAAAPIAGGEAAADESPSARDTSTSDDRSPEATAAHEAAPVPATDVADAAAAIADSAAMNDIVAPAAAVEASDEP